MNPFNGVAVALSAEFPRPQVDPEWLEQCCVWIANEKELSVTEKFQEFFQHVHDQLLKSDLKDSMHHGTGLPELSSFTGNISGPPVLVQIMAIKEIGISAFQLEQIRAAREERILAGVGDEEGEEDGDPEVEGEGPMPKYPRGTLLLRLSDGATEFDGMEYRPIPQVVLGVTKLGYKLQLNGTRFSNGIAFLEPTTIKLLGGECADLHAQWEDNFKKYLQARLEGQAAETLGEARSSPVRSHSRPSRAPLGDISPRQPTLHDDDVDMEPRRKRPSNVSLAEQSVATPSNSIRSIKPLPTRPRKSGELSRNAEVPLKAYPGVPTPGPNRHSNEVSVEVIDSASPPEPEQRIRRTPRRDRRESFDFDLLNEVDDNENAPPRSSNDKGKGRAVDQHSPHLLDGSSDYEIDEEDMFADDNFWEVLDRVEKEALDGELSNTQPKSKGVGSNTLPTSSLASVHDVIELDNDSDEADKENAFVPMRHVRRRKEDLARGRSPVRQPIGKNKAGVIDFSNVIDISDSD